MRKILLLFSMLLFAFNLSAQNYNQEFYLQTAYEALATNKIDVAKKSYNVYKQISGKSDPNFETLLLKATFDIIDLKAIVNIQNEIDSDGEYHGPDWEYDYSKKYLYIKPGRFNRMHFGLRMEFNPRGQSALFALSSDYRIFIIELRNGIVTISTNNGRNYYTTGLPYLPNAWNNLELVHKNGAVSIVVNGKAITLNNVVMNMSNGNNIISCINFSSGDVFSGKIRNLQIYN